MNIFIFSDNSNSEKCFNSIKKVKKYSLNFLPCIELKKAVKNINKNAFIYVDVSNYNDTERLKTLKYLSKLEITGSIYGIIDPKGYIKDTADLFYNGASDYIGKELFKEGILPKRLKKIVEFKILRLENKPKAKNKAEPKKNKIGLETKYRVKREATSKNSYILSGSDWNDIKSGQEYTFCFMFIELDNQKELKEKYGKTHIDEYLKIFHNHIQGVVSRANGKIWMWMRLGGIILFPFDGKKCDAIIHCFRLILNRKIVNIEKYNLKTLLSFRIALHIGNTVYQKRGNTGTIISDSINFIFHFGQKYAQPGNFYLTNDVYKYIPTKLKEFFLSVSQFDDKDVWKMKLL